MWLSERTEKLWLRYLDPRKVVLPSEIHELARGLLDAYRRQLEEKKGEFSFFMFVKEIIDRYHHYIEKICMNVKVKESPDILKWWKEILAVPSIQGILLMSPYALGAPVIKLVLVALYLTRLAWTKRSMRKLIIALERDLREGKRLRAFSFKLLRHEYEMIREEVWSSAPEVDDLAEVLIEAREKIFWKLEKYKPN